MSATVAASVSEAGMSLNFCCCGAQARPAWGAAEAPGCSYAHVPPQAQAHRRWQPSQALATRLRRRSQCCNSWQSQSNSGCDRTHSLSAASHLGGHSLQELQAGIGCASSGGERRHRGGARAAINIDRRRHLEEAFKRQLVSSSSLMVSYLRQGAGITTEARTSR